MRIFTTSSKQALTGISEFPFLNLVSQTWDDYGRQTLFTLWLQKSPGEKISLGKIKIIPLSPSLYSYSGQVVIPDDISELPEGYCSLGQDLDYYHQMLDCFGLAAERVLDKLNDIATNPGVLEEFEGVPEYASSLIRFSEAEKALHRGRNIISGLEYSEVFDFTFSCKIGNSDANHSATLKFNKSKDVPGRMMAVIGANGTGKTQYLSKLALALSGEEKQGEFSPSRPLFSKIIAVSYSAFDKFKRPKSKRTFSYKYCGLKDDSGFMNAKKLEAVYSQACDRLEKQNRISGWYDALGMIVDKEVLEVIGSDLFEKKLYSKVAHNSEGALSSGQSILMYVVTEILANIRDDSLILFDEPEMHLHPQAISNMISMLSYILKRYNAYAILATHSPIILQEIPSNNVRVFERLGNIPNVRSLDIETFGENISNITKTVFSTDSVRQDYKDVLRKLAITYSLEEVEDLFEGRLSMNALIFLKGCYQG